MSIGTYALLAIIAILFVLACRHIFRVTLGGGRECPACRERKMKLHGGLKRE